MARTESASTGRQRGVAPSGVRGAPPAHKRKTTKERPAHSSGRALEVGARQSILRAALAAFSRDGFEGASLPKIAQAAGVAHPLIHYYYGSKQRLWRETVDYAFKGFVTEAATIDVASRGLSPIDRLRILVQAFTHNAARYPDHFGIIMTEVRANSPRLRWLRAHYTGIFYDRLMNILRDARDKKQIKKIPPEHLAPILMGAMLLYHVLSFQKPKGADAAELADRHTKWVLEVLLNGIALQANT